MSGLKIIRGETGHVLATNLPSVWTNFSELQRVVCEVSGIEPSDQVILQTVGEPIDSDTELRSFLTVEGQRRIFVFHAAPPQKQPQLGANDSLSDHENQMLHFTASQYKNVQQTVLNCMTSIECEILLMRKDHKDLIGKLKEADFIPEKLSNMISGLEGYLRYLVHQLQIECASANLPHHQGSTFPGQRIEFPSSSTPETPQSPPPFVLHKGSLNLSAVDRRELFPSKAEQTPSRPNSKPNPIMQYTMSLEPSNPSTTDQSASLTKSRLRLLSLSDSFVNQVKAAMKKLTSIRTGTSLTSIYMIQQLILSAKQSMHLLEENVTEAEKSLLFVRSLNASLRRTGDLVKVYLSPEHPSVMTREIEEKASDALKDFRHRLATNAATIVQGIYKAMADTQSMQDSIIDSANRDVKSLCRLYSEISSFLSDKSLLISMPDLVFTLPRTLRPLCDYRQAAPLQALVISVTKYPKLGFEIPHACDASREFADTLAEIGFSVMRVWDPSCTDLVQNIDTFLTNAKRNHVRVVFVYYNGLVTQMTQSAKATHSLLLPSDSDPSSLDEANLSKVSIQSICKRLSLRGSRSANVVVLETAHFPFPCAANLHGESMQTMREMHSQPCVQEQSHAGILMLVSHPPTTLGHRSEEATESDVDFVRKQKIRLSHMMTRSLISCAKEIWISDALSPRFEIRNWVLKSRASLLREIQATSLQTVGAMQSLPMPCCWMTDEVACDLVVSLHGDVSDSCT